MVPPPAPVVDVALRYSDAREQLVVRAAAVTDQAGVGGYGDPVRWRDSVADAAPELLLLQETSVALADPYTDEVFAAQGADPASDGKVATSAFVDQTDGGGSWLRNLVYAPPSAYQDAIASGVGGNVAQARARYVAAAIVADGIRDMARAADQTAMVSRRASKGYVRVLRGASCGRCAVLAGRHYWVSAFRRHPRCDCAMVPVARDPGGWATDPKAYFRSLSTAQQDEVFGVAGAAAIRAGADISQVVNAYQGVTVVSSFGREIRVTTSGTSVRGLYGGYEVQPDGSLRKRTSRERARLPPRLLPDEIFAQAETEGWTREQTLVALSRFGYVI